MTDAYVHERESTFEDDAMFHRLHRFFMDGIEQKVFSPDLPAEYIANLYVYVVHGIDFNAALYKRPWNGWDWCDQFFTFVEEQHLRPYLL